MPSFIHVQFSTQFNKRGMCCIYIHIYIYKYSHTHTIGHNLLQCN